METSVKTKLFNKKKSIKKSNARKGFKKWTLASDGKKQTWSSKIERLQIIREGVPYSALEIISKRLDSPIKFVLSSMEIPQTTYNKKKSEHALLDSRDSELVLLIIELIDYGVEVFNTEEDKFKRWLKKPNLSLGGSTPESLLDTITGINEVNYCLNRLEYGSLA